MKKSFFNSRGFTLIELLVVIAIIAILSAVIVKSISSSRSKARDAKRISDVAQIQLALEQYFDKNGIYPSTANFSTSLSPEFISTIPRDPSNGSSYYYGTPLDRLDYVVSTILENPNPITSEGIISAPGEYYYGTACSNATGEANVRVVIYCVGPK